MSDETEPTTGGCYCGQVRYQLRAAPILKAQCHCRPCQYISGGGPNYFMIVPAHAFAYAKGAPTAFARPDLDNPVTREFCATCGTHLITRLPERPLVVVKVGTLDDPALFGAPKRAIHCLDKQPFHLIPEGIEVFDRLPG